MNTKAKGTRLEHQSMKILERRGYRCTRSAASLGEFDIIAIGAYDFRLIQVKANRNASPGERQKIEAVPVPENAPKEIWIWTDRCKYPKVLRLCGEEWEEI